MKLIVPVLPLALEPSSILIPDAYDRDPCGYELEVVAPGVPSDLV